MTERNPKKGKKAKVALKDLEVKKVKGGVDAEEDPTGGGIAPSPFSRMESPHKLGVGQVTFPKIGTRFDKD